MTTRAKRKAKNTKSVSKSNPDKSLRANCPHCSGGAETYGYLKRRWVFDVDRARKLVSDGRDAVELETSDVAYLVNDSRIHEQHIDHVNTKYPGILAHLWGPGRNGETEHGHVLIDGNHRAARCLRDNIPFRAYLLTEAESERMLLRGMMRDGTVRNDLGDKR